MSYIRLFIFAGITLSLLAGCANKSTEQFSEGFFTYKDDSGKKYFTFILSLESDELTRSGKKMTTGNRRGGQKGGGQQVFAEEPSAIPENPEDAKVPLKFRMEEIAHAKLIEKLEAIEYCPQKVEYEKEEYKRYRFKIKGYCTE